MTPLISSELAAKRHTIVAARTGTYNLSIATTPMRIDPLLDRVGELLRCPRLRALVISYSSRYQRLPCMTEEKLERIRIRTLQLERLHRGRVIVHQMEDRGPICKFLGARKLGRTNRPTIICDDDTHYNPRIFQDLVSGFLSEARQPPSSKPRRLFCNCMCRVSNRYIMEGFAGICVDDEALFDSELVYLTSFYKCVDWRRTIDDVDATTDVFTFERLMAACFLGDDALLSWWLGEYRSRGRGIVLDPVANHRGVIRNKRLWDYVRQIPIGFAADALHKNRVFGSNNATYEYFFRWGPPCLPVLLRRHALHQELLRLHDALAQVTHSSSTGSLALKLSPSMDRFLMQRLFPVDRGANCKTIAVTHAFMRTVDLPEYLQRCTQTQSLLPEHLPPLTRIMGFKAEDLHGHGNVWRNFIHEHARRPHLTAGLLDVCFRMITCTNEVQWAWVFEDDVRFCNCEPDCDLRHFHNVPEDAEMLVPCRGDATKVYRPLEATYRPTWNGAQNHAIVLSVAAARKILAYARKYQWQGNSDNDLYRICRGSRDVAVGWGGWMNARTARERTPVRIPEAEKIIAYSLNTYICNQTSVPCWRGHRQSAIPCVDMP